MERKIIDLNGIKYMSIERKAKAGEQVIDIADGNKILTIVETPYDSEKEWYEFETEHGTDIAPISSDEYRVIKRLDENASAHFTQEERITAICDEVKALLIRKNRDYGDSFAKQFAKYGVLSGLIRIDDKISRLDNLVGGAEDSVGESVEDSCADLAGYAILTLLELRKSKEAGE